MIKFILISFFIVCAISRKSPLYKNEWLSLYDGGKENFMKFNTSEYNIINYSCLENKV